MKYSLKKYKYLTIFFLPLFFLLTITNIKAASPSIQYATHVQDIGWMNNVNNNEISGTVGQSKRLEAITININTMPADSSIQYSTHVQDIGWQNYVSNGQVSGTTGQSKRLEGIKIRLTGTLAKEYDIYYRSHVQDIGWQNWVKNDELSGTTGQSKRLEAIQIQLVPKDQKINEVNPSSNGELRVSGNHLVDQNNTPVQLKGVSTHGINWFPGYVNQSLFSELKTNWNANVVRLAMYTADYNGYCSGGNKEELKQLVRNGINYATNAGLYVIVDWHILSDSNPLEHKEEAKEFFNTISSEYKNANNILYEICNEPNGGTSWDQIKSYAEEIIPVIRNNDSNAVILVGTPTWSQDIHLVAQNPLNYPNIMYTFHFYAGTHKDDLRNRLISTVNSGIPVFVSEFGITDASGNGNVDEASGNAWISTLNDLNVSYVCWNLSNKNESSALIKDNVSKLSGYGQNDLTQQGKWLVNILNSNLTNSANPVTPDNNQNNQDNSSNNNQTEVNQGSISYRLTLANSWQSGSQYFYQYSLSVKNNGNGVLSKWEVTLKANTNFEVDNIWNSNYTKSNSQLTLKNVDYNGTIQPGSTINDVGFIIKSDKPLELK